MKVYESDGIGEVTVLMSKLMNRVACLLLLVMCLGIVGCQKSADKDNPIIIELNESKVRLDEVMVYMIQTVNEFEQLGGEDVWEIEDFSGGKTAGEVAKQRVLENLIRIKILVSKQEQLGIVIDETTKENLLVQSRTYFEKLPKAFVEAYGITQKTIDATFVDHQIASLIASKLTENFEAGEGDIDVLLMENPDYMILKDQTPQDLLTQLKVKQIMVRTHEVKEDGELVSFDEEALNKAKEQIEAAQNAIENGYSMDEAISKYSDELGNIEDDGSVVISKGLLSKTLSKSIEELDVGEISKIIQGERGYYIFQLLSIKRPTEQEIIDYDKSFNDWVTGLRLEAKKKLTNEAFESIYNDWKNEEVVDVNQNLWSAIDVMTVVSYEKFIN